MFKLKPNSSPASLHWKCHSVDKPKQMHSKCHTSYPGIMVPSARLARQGNNLWCLPMTAGVPKGPGGEGTHRGLEDKAWCQGLRWPTIARELLTPHPHTDTISKHHAQSQPQPMGWKPTSGAQQPACQWCQKEQKNHGCGAWSQPVSHHSSLTALGPGINRWWERSSGLCPTQWAEYLLPPPHRSIFAPSLRGVINIHSELSRIRFPMHEDVYYLFIFKAC